MRTHQPCNAMIAALLTLAAICLCPGCRRNVPPESDAASTPVSHFMEKYELSGKVALLEFGTIGCEKSGEGLDAMINLHRRELIPGLSFVRIERSDNKADADNYYADKKPGFPVHHDPDSELARAFGATAYPAFVLVGKFGRVRYRGNFPEKHLTEWTESLVAENSDPGEDVALFGGAELSIRELLTTTELPSVHNNKTLPLAFYAGKGGLMLVFVDTSCPFAGQAISDLPNVARTLSWYKLTTVLVNVDDAKDATLSFYKQRALSLPVVYDTTTATRLRWGVSSVPTVFLVGSDYSAHYTGPAVWKHVAQAAEKSLGLSAGDIKFDSAGTEYG